MKAAEETKPNQTKQKGKRKRKKRNPFSPSQGLVSRTTQRCPLMTEGTQVSPFLPCPPCSLTGLLGVHGVIPKGGVVLAVPVHALQPPASLTSLLLPSVAPARALLLSALPAWAPIPVQASPLVRPWGLLAHPLLKLSTFPLLTPLVPTPVTLPLTTIRWVLFCFLKRN